MLVSSDEIQSLIDSLAGQAAKEKREPTHIAWHQIEVLKDIARRLRQQETYPLANEGHR